MSPFKGVFFATPFGRKSESFQTPVMENSKGLDSAKAHELVEGCLNAVLATLERKQLVGATSSRRFILQYLGSNLLANVRRGETMFLTTYPKLMEAWADLGESGIGAGTEKINPTATCSLWAKTLHRGKKRYFALSIEDYTLQLRLHRPNDDENRKHGIAGNVGFVVQIFNGKSPVSVVPTDQDLQPISGYWTQLVPSGREQERKDRIDRITVRLRDALSEQPQQVLEVLDAHPEKLTFEHGMGYWSTFLKTTRRVAAILAAVFLGSVAAVIVSAPHEARAQMANGWKELRAGLAASYERWCIGCDEPNRTVHWEFEHPEAYYTPNSVYLGIKRRDFTLTALPATVLPTVHSEQAHVEVVSDPSDELRVRIAVSPGARFRRHDTKYYINFGDDPAIRGAMNKMIAVGPAALMEHVFPKSGRYTIHVGVATRMPESVRASDPSLSRPALPPSEDDMYTVAEAIVIKLRVGD